jgi:hypothetical protein
VANPLCKNGRFLAILVLPWAEVFIMRYAWLLGIVVTCSLLAGQTSHRKPLPDIPPENVPTVQHARIDAAQLRREAEELATLAQSIPPDVEKLGTGLHPKELEEKLKRIEKLSKRLRRDLWP